MAGTIIDYVKEYGDRKWSEEPLNDVDALVLSQLSYLKFDGIVPEFRENRPSLTLRDIYQHESYEKLYADERFEKDNRALFEGMLSSGRYADLRLNCYMNIVNKSLETQFCAVTFLLEDLTFFVAYRGTDESIVGWKEDFNMAFMDPIPGQDYSVRYLNSVMSRMHNKIYVGGHSKGGNLAVYAAMKCIPSVRERILKVYSLDGPGFRPKVLESGSFGVIEEKMVKILPRSSLVGMIFEKDIRYQTVESRSFGLAQHNPYTWIVENGRFKEAEDIYERRKFMDAALNEWILSLDEEKCRIFVDTLFHVIDASGADDLITFTKDLKKSMRGMYGALKEVDPETSRMIKEIIRSLYEMTRERMTAERKIKIPGRQRKTFRIMKENSQEEEEN